MVGALVLYLCLLLSPYCQGLSHLRALTNVSAPPAVKTKPSLMNVSDPVDNSTNTMKPKPKTPPMAKLKRNQNHKLTPAEIVNDLGNLTALFNQYNATEMESDLAAYITNVTDILYQFNYNNSEFLLKLNYMIKHEDYSNLTSLISNYNETQVEVELKSGVKRVKKLVLFPDKEGENSYRNRIILWSMAIIIAYLTLVLLFCLVKVFGGFSKFVFYCIYIPLRFCLPIRSQYKPLKTGDGDDDEYNANAEMEDFEDEDTTIESDVHKIETVPLSEDEEFERMMTLGDGETSFDAMGKQIDDVIDAVASEFEMPPMGVSIEGSDDGKGQSEQAGRMKEFRF